MPEVAIVSMAQKGEWGMAKKKDIGDVVEDLDEIVIELMKANTIGAMKLLHTVNGTKYSPKELEWLACVVDADELCSGDEDEADEDEPHS
jgi:hypothetical protein